MEAGRKLSLQEKIAQLRNDYLSRLPLELTQLADLSGSLFGGERDRPVLVELHQRLHKLTGTGGSFGLIELSKASRVIEQRIQEWLQDEGLACIAGQDRVNLARDIAGLSTVAADVMLAETVPDQPQQVPGRKPDGLRNPRLWLVEPDAARAQAMRQQIESFNYELRLFASFSLAEEAIATETPNVIMLSLDERDQGLPAPDSALTRLDRPLLVIGHHDDFESRVKAAQLGAVGYFLQPLDVPRLVSRITQILEDWRAPAERVLIIEDDADLAEHTQLVLQAANMSARVLLRPHQVLAALIEFKPELVLMDLHMPDYSGTDLAGVIRQYDEYLNLPIVYLSAETDLQQQIRAIRRGADDFLVKPVSDLQLVATVRSRIARARQLNEQILRDSLTGLLKHAAIKAVCHDQIVRSRTQRQPLTLVMLDIDHFKQVNDSHGHATGDRVIAAVAILLRQRVRQTDVLGRYGGEEFLVVLPNCTSSDAVTLMESIRQHFAGLRFGSQEAPFSCTLSFGLACTADFLDSDAADLLEKADQALYRAKTGGRNQTQVALVS